MSDREEGYYWVRYLPDHDNDFGVAEFYNKKWWIIGIRDPIEESVFDHIGDKIEHPNQQ